jgi:indolepyruvate ferredoxin oxidoreductase beta subunit
VTRSNTTLTSTANIVLTGVGGQGVLTLAELLAKAALEDSMNVRVGEIHGMAQRGGHVVCTVRIGSQVFGPIVDPGTADVLVGFEPVETLREINLMKPSGWVIMNSHTVHPVAVSMGKAHYPGPEIIHESIHKFTQNLLEFDAGELARAAGSTVSLNIVMMGAVVGTGIVPISEASALKCILTAFPERFSETNTAAFRLGYRRARGIVVPSESNARSEVS